MKKRDDEVSQQGDGDHEAGSRFHDSGGHSFATPLAMSATSANTAIAVTTKATSAIVSS